MKSHIAPLHGTTSNYRYLHSYEVVLWKDDYSYTLVRPETFQHLYFELDGERAALKEDCIEYVIYRYDKTADEYPDWYLEAVDNGLIFNVDDVDMFYGEKGEIAMSPCSIVLRNYRGQLMYMEPRTFSRYYELIGG